MTVLQMWMRVLSLLIAGILTANVPIEPDGDVLDATAGETFLVKTWAENRQLKSITVTRDNAIRLTAIFIKTNFKISKDFQGVILLKYNNATREISLILENFCKEDEGIYNVEELVADTSPNPFERKAGKWNFKLNVIDQTTNAITGGNVTIGWFYSQQGINRTLRIIHSNNGIMMMVPPNNEPQIVPDFQERLIYSGEISKCYMSLTLLNIGKADSGVYKIETLHGNTVSGWKRLIVEGITITTTPSNIERYTHLTDSPSTYTSVHILYTQPNSVSIGSRYTANLNTRFTDMPHYTPTGSAYDQQTTIRNTIGVPIYVVIPMAVVILALTGCVIWIHHKRKSTMETDRPHSIEECDHDLYLTPVGGERHLPIRFMNDGHAADSITAQFDSGMQLLHKNQNMSMDGYETVDVSSNDASETVFNSDETVYEPTETISKPADDNFGYLTVLGLLETSV